MKKILLNALNLNVSVVTIVIISGHMSLVVGAAKLLKKWTILIH